MVVDDRDENVGNASRRPEQSTAFTAARSAAAAAANLPARQGSRDHCLRRCVYCRRRDIARHRLNNKTLLYPTSIYIHIYICIGTGTLEYRQNILKRKIWFKPMSDAMAVVRRCGNPQRCDGRASRFFCWPFRDWRGIEYYDGETTVLRCCGIIYKVVCCVITGGIPNRGTE